MDYCSEYVLDCCRGFVFATPRLHVPESQASIGDRSARSHAHASVAPPSHPGPAFPPPGAPPSLGPRVGRVESGSDPNRSTCGSRTRWVGFSGAFRASPGHARHGRAASRRRHDAGTTTPRNRGSRGISGMPGIRASRSEGRAACAVARRRGFSQARESGRKGQSRLTHPSRSASPPAVPLCENGADPRSPAGSCMTGHRSGSGRPGGPCGSTRCRL